MSINVSKAALIFALVIAASIVLTACGGAATPAPTQDVSLIQTQAAQQVIADMTQNAPPPPPPATEVPTQEVAPPPGSTPDPNIPVAVIPTPAPGEPTAVANYNTYIFGGPGENYVVYATFLGSATAKVVGRSEDSNWWAISVPVAPTGAGWVSAAWVTVSNVDSVPTLPTPPVPPTTGLIPPEPGDPQATALTNVAVRTGPGTNFPAYGIANAGANGRVIGRSEDGLWWVVRLDPATVGAGYGWVSGQYVRAENVADVQIIATPDAPVQAPPPPPPAGAPVATAVDYLNVRSGPGTNYPVLVTAPPGASGEVSGKSADGAWWQVKISTAYAADGFGWVSAAYVLTQNTENVPVVDAPPAPPTVGPTPPPPTGTGCALVAQEPADATAFPRGTAFSTTWVLQNTGDTKWDQKEYDMRFVGAANNVRMHQGSDLYDLASTVEPGWTYNFSVPMIAPYEPGTFGEMWELVLGSQTICQFYVYIQAQ